MRSPQSASAEQFEQFEKFHSAQYPLLLPNAWDAASAALFQKQGASAIATSSAALAWSLGYADGGALPRHELLAAIQRIKRVLQVPLSIDLEDGYSDSPREVAALIRQVAELGVAGINLEDGAANPQNLADKISAARQSLGVLPLFINARTDVYLRQLTSADQAVGMCVERLKQYHLAGADGAFVPGMTEVSDVRQLVAGLNFPKAMPLNLMLLPAISSGASMLELFQAGVRRFSTGPATFLAAYNSANTAANQLLYAGKWMAASIDQAEPEVALENIRYDIMNGLF